MYKVGEILKVREWNDMAEEFGLDDAGDIKCVPSFVKSMKYMCGEKFTVKGITVGRLYTSYISEEGIEGEFAISEKMLEPLNGIPEFDIASEDELGAFLFS